MSGILFRHGVILW